MIHTSIHMYMYIHLDKFKVLYMYIDLKSTQLQAVFLIPIDKNY